MQRNQQIRPIEYFVLSCLLSAALLRQHASAQDASPNEAFSPSYAYRLTIDKRPDAKMYDEDDSTLVIWKRNRKIASFATNGWIASAWWSPGEKYVALNNRRANWGDYLWIFRLSDGRILRKPCDALTSHTQTHLFSYIQGLEDVANQQYPNSCVRNFAKFLTEAKGWVDSETVNVESTIMASAPQDHADIVETYAIKNSGLVLKKRSVSLVPMTKAELDSTQK